MMFDWPQLTWRSFLDRPLAWLIFFGLILPGAWISRTVQKNVFKVILFLVALVGYFLYTIHTSGPC